MFATNTAILSNVKLVSKIKKNEKRKITEGITKIFEEAADKPPAVTYIVIKEVNQENWAAGGKGCN